VATSSIPRGGYGVRFAGLHAGIMMTSFSTRYVLQARIPSLQLLFNKLFCFSAGVSLCSEYNTKQMAQNSVRRYSCNKLINNNDRGTWSLDVLSVIRFLAEETCFKHRNLRQLLKLWRCTDKTTGKKILRTYKVVEIHQWWLHGLVYHIKHRFKFSMSGGNKTLPKRWAQFHLLGNAECTFVNVTVLT
jgi:hypothetical protein